jgi:hypothetical protein
MTGAITSVVIGAAGVASGAYQGHKARKAGKEAAESAERVASEESQVQRDIAANAEALNRERYLEAKGLLMPRVRQSDIAQNQLMAELGLGGYQTQPLFSSGGYQAQPQFSSGGYRREPVGRGFAPQDGGGGPFDLPGNRMVGASIRNLPPSEESYYEPLDPTTFKKSTSYMDIPGYQAAIDESLRAVEQAGNYEGATSYGGRRLKAAGQVGAGVQQSYYNNYMNMLQNIAQPQVAQNLASMGVNQGANIGSQNIVAGQASSNAVLQGNQQANESRLAGTAASNAAIGDVMGGIMNMGAGALQGGYFNKPGNIYGMPQTGTSSVQYGDWLS